MKTIGFIGLGLIGGSIAKAIRKYHEDYRILAYDQDRETLATAVSSNMIDAVCEEHDERFKGCDYIFLCTPVEYNVKYLEYFKENIGPDTIITWHGIPFYRRPSNGRFGENRIRGFQ